MSDQTAISNLESLNVAQLPPDKYQCNLTNNWRGDVV